MASRTATLAVKKIVEDLSDRRGLKQEWNAIDADIRKEICAAWAKAIDDAYTSVVTGGQQ